MDAAHEFQQNFAQIYERISKFAALRLPTAEDKEDIVAESLTQAWENIDQYRADTGDLMGWIVGITRHKVADFWRRRPTVALDDIPEPPSNTSGKRIEEQIDAQLIVDAMIAELPQSSRALLTLRHVDGFSYEEMAEVTGKSVDAVRQAVSRLHRYLRQNYE